MPSKQRAAFRGVAVAALLLGSGCSPQLVSRQTPFMENVGDIDMSARELRVRVVEFGRYFAAAIEESADAIIQQTDDPMARRHALVWKSRAIPAAQEAVLQIDPLMSLVDIWAFALQLEVFFDTGAGAGWFADPGGSEGVNPALATASRLAADAKRLAEFVSVSGDVDIHLAEIKRWVDNHPIDKDLLLRDSVIGSGANLLGDQRGAFALVEDMNATAREVAYRLAFYNEYLLKQLRWAVELGGDEFFSSSRADSAMSALMRTLAVAESATTLLDEIARREREELLRTVAAERSLMLGDIERQRLETIGVLASERELVLGALTGERIAAMDAVSAEREATMVVLREMFEAGKLESRAVVDHAMYRLAQLLAVAGAVLVILAVVFLLLARRLFVSRT